MFKFNWGLKLRIIWEKKSSQPYPKRWFTVSTTSCLPKYFYSPLLYSPSQLAYNSLSYKRGLCCQFPAFFSLSQAPPWAFSSSFQAPDLILLLHTAQWRDYGPLSLPQSLQQCCVSTEKMGPVQCCSPHIVAARAGGTRTWWSSTDFVSVLLTM